jgi:hypothetical protein
MNSFRLFYDAEGDIFEVDFRLAGEKPERGYELSDNVVVWTDAKINKVHRILFLSYSRLLERSVVTLGFLKGFPTFERSRIQRALERNLVKQFLLCRDKETCRYSLAEPDWKKMLKAA